MADKQISELTAGTIGSNNDAFMFDNASGVTYKLPYSDLAGAVIGQSLGAGTGINITTDSGSTIYKKIISVDTDTEPIQYSNKPITSGAVYYELGNKQDTLTIDSSVIEDSENPVEGGAVYTALEEKQDVLTIDSTPTEDSENPVESGGVWTALRGKQNTLTFDQTPTQNSNNPVTSGGVWSAIQGGGGGGGMSRTLLYNDTELSSTMPSTISFQTRLTTYDCILIEYWRYDDASHYTATPLILQIPMELIDTLYTVYTGMYLVGIILPGVGDEYAFYEINANYKTLELDTGRSNIPTDISLTIHKVWGINYS